MRVWELEGGNSNSRRRRWDAAKSVRVQQRQTEKGLGDVEDRQKDMRAIEEKKRWVGFDDEMVIVLSVRGEGQALMVYDFT